MFKRTYIFICFALCFYLGYSQQKHEEKPYLIIVSLDGFRWDYPEIYKLPVLDSISKVGVKAKSLKSCFPTVTFPNHYSIATGLYPDEHGIVQNQFYDSKLDRSYKIGDKKAVADGRFYGGEPIWVTAEKQGIKTATFYWVGSEAEIKGIRPSYWKPYENTIPFHQRVDTITHWLQLPDSLRPHLILFYLPEPDAVSHEYGTISQETGLMVRYLDSIVGILINNVSRLDVAAKVNYIILSDHGMADLDSNKLIVLENYIKPSWVKKYYGYNPTYNIAANDNCADSIYYALKKIKHLKVWKKGKLPKRLKYGNNDRIGDIVLVARNGWSVSPKGGAKPYGGAHGYDNSVKDMHGIFYALGPAFKKNYKAKTFENIYIYSIAAKILNIEPSVYHNKFKQLNRIIKH